MFGTIEPRKGQDLAIRGLLALPKSVQSAIKFRIFGQVVSEQVRKTISQLANGHKFIEISDNLPQVEYLDELAKSDIVMITSRDEPFSCVALDAVMSGVPIICSETVGISAYLENKKSAVILDNYEPDTIAEAVANLVRDPKLRRSMGDRGHAVYRKHFTMQAFAERLDAAIKLE